MNTENFLELPLESPGIMACVSKTSIAAIEDKGPSGGCIVTLKERRTDGTQIVFNVQLAYSHLKSEINKWEKLTP